MSSSSSSSSSTSSPPPPPHQSSEATNQASSQQQQQQQQQLLLQEDIIISRRRDKRRHVTSNSIDLRDPFAVIALAIRLDESNAIAANEDSLLRVPLETGSIYNQKAFSKALLHLQKKTALPRKSTTNTASTPSSTGEQYASSDEAIPSQHPSSQQVPLQAVTPIILSGLVAAIQDQQQQQQQQDDNDDYHNGTSAVELVAYCRSMRRAALGRVRIRLQRRRIQQNVTPFIVLGILVALIVWSASRVRWVMIEYGFVYDEELCHHHHHDDDVVVATTTFSSKACRFASAQVWEYVNPAHPLHISACTMEVCSIVEGQIEFPFYAMHTLLQPAFMSLSEMDNPRKTRPKVVTSSGGGGTSGSSTRRSHGGTGGSGGGPLSPLQWLGETSVNRLVREAIAEYHPSTIHPVQILDCGCGIGGTLYSLLNFDLAATQQQHQQQHHHQKKDTPSFSYHGIAISTPEIIQAKRLLDLHDILKDDDDDNTTNPPHIRFEQHHFDTPLKSDPTTTTTTTTTTTNNNSHYSVIVAIESLTYSPNLQVTIHNLLQSLQSNGIVIIADDIVAPWTSQETRDRLRLEMGKPSLLTYQEWQEIIANSTSSSSLEFKSVRDLGLEMDMVDLLIQDPTQFNWFNSLLEWRLILSRFMTKQWIALFGKGESLQHKAFLRMVQLVQDMVETIKANSARQQAYSDAELSYYFMVLVKK